MAEIVRRWCRRSPKPITVSILGYVAQNQIPRAPTPPAAPTFCGFQASKSPNETPALVVTWWSRRAARPAHGGGQRWVHDPGQKMIFSKVVRRPRGMLKQVFLGHFEPVVMRFGPWKMPKCLDKGPFWDQNWVNNGSKTLFSKSDPGPLGVHKQVKLAHFEPILTQFSPFRQMYALFGTI